MKHITIQSELTLIDRSEIKEKWMLDMIHAAEEAAELAYAPYSKFKVGVALLLKDGSIVKGANQENASFPVGTCAETITLGAARTQHPNKEIEKMFIAVPSADSPISPCGMCRQSILEHERRQNKKIDIYLIGKSDLVLLRGVQTILPLAFDGEKLL